MRNGIALCLLAGAVVVTGCTGGSSTPSAVTGGRSVATVFLTDGFREEFAHVWATVYKVELIPQDGGTPVVVFEDSSGRLIDLKTLRDTDGERYTFLSSASVPAGVYSGVNVTVGATMQLMKNGETLGDPLAVDSSIPLDANGHPVLTMTFKSAKTLGSGSTSVIVDFNLARFIVRNSKVLPALTEGEGIGLHNPLRHEKDEYRGTVSNLSGTAPTLTFTLNRGNGTTVTVTTTESTALFGDTTLVDGAVVDVTGTLDTTTQTIVATQIEVRPAGTPGVDHAGDCAPRVVGTASEIDATTGVLTVTVERGRGLNITQTTVRVTTDTATVYRGDSGATVTAAEFFTALATTPSVVVEGTYDETSNTLTATLLRVFDPTKDGGWSHGPHGFRDTGKGLKHWGNGTLPR